MMCKCPRVKAGRIRLASEKAGERHPAFTENRNSESVENLSEKVFHQTKGASAKPTFFRAPRVRFRQEDRCWERLILPLVVCSA